MVTPIPAIILIRPQLGENIGAAARAMMNFGLRDLRLVAPRDGWPNDDAIRMAAHATSILDDAKLFDSTREALADIRIAYGTTARGRDMPKPVYETQEILRRCAAHAQNNIASAILFGPERTGLENEDLALCDAILTIPTDPGNGSLNIAQSVVIVAYEWFRQAGGKERIPHATTSPYASPVNPESQSPPATKEELAGFFDHLERALDETDFFKTEQKKPRMWQNLRAVFSRAELTEQEVRTLHGVLTSLRTGK